MRAGQLNLNCVKATYNSQRNLLLGGFDSVTAMADVAARSESIVTTDGS